MKFKIYSEGKLVKDFKLNGAFVFGTDDIAVRKSVIQFKNGTLICKKATDATSGLALLWKVDGFGKVMLQTTCLPERERPYILNLELARGKIMQIINKREDWSFFNDINNLNEKFQEIQGLFTEALQNIDQPEKASKLADRSLAGAVQLAEDFAVMQSEQAFKQRVKNKSLGRGCLSCRLDLSKIDNPSYIEKMQSLFSFISIPVNWAEIEKQKGEYDFSELDSVLKAVAKKKMALAAGPLLKFAPEYIPSWLKKQGVTFQEIRDSAYNFITKIVARYSNLIKAWQVISSMNVVNFFGFSFEQMLEITRAGTMAVKATNNKAFKIIVISNPWGEYYANSQFTIPPIVYLDMVIQSGIKFNAFGLDLAFGKDQDGMHIRDMMQLSSVLDLFSLLGKPLYITDLQIPSSTIKNSVSAEAGIWHRQWDEKLQKQWLEKFYKIALGKPFVDSVSYSSLMDNNNLIIPNSGLMDENMNPRESFKVLDKLRNNIFKK